MRGWHLLIFAIIIGFLQSCDPQLPEEVALAYDALPDKLDYNLHVKPVLSDKCFACHGPDEGKRKAELRLDIREAAVSPLPESPGKVAIDPGNAAGSELFHRILSYDPEYMMPDPKSHHILSEGEKAILIKWISDGAEYQPHWAFVKPRSQEVPEVAKGGYTVNPIDNFILQELAEKNLKPSPEAQKEILLRRVSLDLTGLPPTLDEVEEFLRDSSPNAYEKQVDRLLSSPHYGEKMAVDWLDLARFADSHGYTVDRLRDMSPYRDWVIKSFNENISYDKFLHWQLAGDLMPNPSRDMIIATAFNRNHQQNMEGGIVEEEFQTEYVVDRTNTFGDAFLGLSLGCARCHDHKFDPVSQKNYYQLYSFFNNVKEAGQIAWNDAMPTPTLLLPTEAQEKIIRSLEQDIAVQQETIVQLAHESAEASFKKWIDLGFYRHLSEEKFPHKNLIARYSFDDGTLGNIVGRGKAGIMKQLSGKENPSFEKRGTGMALVLNGDTWLDLNDVGIFRKSDPFTIGISINVPEDLKEGVVFHKSIAERLYNFRGYHLYLNKNGTLEFSVTHTAPSNAITVVSEEDVPRDRWVHLAVTYDGSSRAGGIKLFMDGNPLRTEILMDQLTKDILFSSANLYGTRVEPGLQVGAWDRGFGLKGGKADDIMLYDRALTAFEVKILSGRASWAAHVNAKSGELSADALKVLKEYYVEAIDSELSAARKALNRMRKVLADSMEAVQELMVMQEMPKPRRSFVLNRGSYDAPGEEVFPATPAAVLPFPENLPRNRYGLAQWLTQDDHPLTARVAVNRFWQNFFGTGLVKTAEDFGNQGELPSHPELLDWLAVTFRESGWNVKQMIKLIVMSATYRQDSRSTPQTLEQDPENRLLSRGPAYRMPAEMIRDNALVASGLINKAIGGRSIKPYQPEGLWQINSAHYAADTGALVYRRSLYVLVKRAVPNPTLATFDATTRSYCVVRRQKTNTPLQALVTLNDPTFVEASRALGEQMAKVADLRQGITETFRKLTGRSPSPDEVTLMEELRTATLKRFIQHPEKAQGWLTTGQKVINKSEDVLVIAANAVVASTILNSDASLTKR